VVIKTAPISELTEKDRARFWSKVGVKSPNECWEWIKGKRGGYGRFCLNGKDCIASRVAWTLVNGPIPLGKLVLHTCDNQACNNPVHLFLGTNKDNTQDAVKRGRLATGDKNGSRLHPEKRARGSKHGRVTCPEKTARGEKHGSSKVTNIIVLEMRKRCFEGETKTKLAKDYGISKVQAGNIVNGKSWVHLR